MISGLRGKVLSVQEGVIFIDTASGIVFSVKVPANYAISEGEEIFLYVHTIFSQQSGFELYGFREEEGLKVFRALLEVPGIGPAMALRILSELSLKEIAVSVRTGNVSVLRRVKGLGTKKAEMVIFALKDVPLPESEEDMSVSEAVKALTTLGMDHVEARSLVAEAVRRGFQKVEDLISYALKNRVR
jgi:Holliday junction DNA helicase RuvA